MEQLGTVQIENYGSNEKIFYPENALDVSDCPKAESREAGTLAYYKPWDDVVIFYGPYSPAEGLYELGRLEDPDEETLSMIAEMEPGEYSVWQMN